MSTKEKGKNEAVEGFAMEVIPPSRSRKKGLWTLHVNGRETFFYSSNQWGIKRFANTLLNGVTPGTVRLSTLKAGAKLQGDDKRGAATTSAPAWAEKKTPDGRIAAYFLQEGVQRLTERTAHEAKAKSKRK